MRETPVLYIVIPCYNEQEVLPITAPMFRDKLLQLAQQGIELLVRDGRSIEDIVVMIVLVEFGTELENAFLFSHDVLDFGAKIARKIERRSTKQKKMPPQDLRI